MWITHRIFGRLILPGLCSRLRLILRRWGSVSASAWVWLSCTRISIGLRCSLCFLFLLSSLLLFGIDPAYAQSGCDPCGPPPCANVCPAGGTALPPGWEPLIKTPTPVPAGNYNCSESGLPDNWGTATPDISWQLHCEQCVYGATKYPEFSYTPGPTITATVVPTATVTATPAVTTTEYVRWVGVTTVTADGVSSGVIDPTNSAILAMHWTSIGYAVSGSTNVDTNACLEVSAGVQEVEFWTTEGAPYRAWYDPAPIPAMNGNQTYPAMPNGATDPGRFDVYTNTLSFTDGAAFGLLPGVVQVQRTIWKRHNYGAIKAYPSYCTTGGNHAPRYGKGTRDWHWIVASVNGVSQLGPVPTATPEPATATPVPTAIVSDCTHIPDDPWGGEDFNHLLPNIAIGPKSCPVDVGGTTIDLSSISWLPGMSVFAAPIDIPQFKVCHREIDLGSVGIFDLTVDINILAGVILAIAGLFVVMRS